MRKVTQQDIAEALGVSKFAVSRALADKPGVSADTRADVIAKAEALGYHRGASQARDEKAEVLFVFGTPDTVQGAFWIRILQGAQEEAQRRGVRTGLHFVSGVDDLSGISKRVAGMVLSGPLEEQVFEVAARLRIPLVRTSAGPLLDRIDRVMLADFESGMVAAEHLVKLGHRRAVYAEGTPALRGRAERLRGFRQGFPAPVDSLTFDERVGIGPALDRLIAAGEMPTAVFCASDGIGVNAVSELMRRGLAVPGDVSVVGYLDDPAATQIAPALTTVRVPVRYMGIMIMRCLLDRMNAADPYDIPPRRIQLIPEFIVRESTGPAPRIAGRLKDGRSRRAEAVAG